MSRRSRRVTKAQVVRKMKRLGITGWSSVNKVTFADHMKCLKEIERIQKRRKAATKKK